MSPERFELSGVVINLQEEKTLSYSKLIAGIDKKSYAITTS
jgi:hypothetical protein